MVQCIKVGDCFKIRGDGWIYESVGEVHKFTQYRKLPSIRRIKDTIKMLRAALLCEGYEVRDKTARCYITSRGFDCGVN